MALHPTFPVDPHVILDPGIRWFPADEAYREKRADQLIPPLVATLRKEVKTWRHSGYADASPTTKSLLTWWFATQHLMQAPVANARGSPLQDFQYFFAQREALETIVYLYDVVGVKGKHFQQFPGLLREGQRRGNLYR